MVDDGGHVWIADSKSNMAPMMMKGGRFGLMFLHRSRLEAMSKLERERDEAERLAKAGEVYLNYK